MRVEPFKHFALDEHYVCMWPYLEVWKVKKSFQAMPGLSERLENEWLFICTFVKYSLCWNTQL